MDSCLQVRRLAGGFGGFCFLGYGLGRSLCKGSFAAFNHMEGQNYSLSIGVPDISGPNSSRDPNRDHKFDNLSHSLETKRPA